jgi:hypothetical protein
MQPLIEGLSLATLVGPKIDATLGYCALSDTYIDKANTLLAPSIAEVL